MDESIVHLFRDPRDGGGLILDVSERDGDEIITGELRSESGNVYPVIDGIPRFVSAEHYSVGGETEGVSKAVQTSRSFGKKWNEESLSKELEEEGIIDDLKLQLYSMLDCKSDDEYKELMGSTGLCLNAGCGTAWSEEFFNTNRETVRLGMDLSLSVETAFSRTRKMENVHIVQGDILNPPFEKESFDIVFSDGVVHHTPDPGGAVLTLCNLLKTGGVLGLYIYCVKPFLRELADEKIREITTRMDYEECLEFSRRMTSLGKSLVGLEGEVEIEEDIPLLGIKKGRYNPQRFIYDHFLKCFYSQTRSRDYSDLVNVDWYHPAHASHHTREEIEGWLSEGNMTDWVFTQPPGWEYSGYFIKAVKK